MLLRTPKDISIRSCVARFELPRACPECKADDSFAACGPGVERIQEEVQALLPEARTFILASDVITSPSMISGAVRDIEDRKQADRALRTSERNLIQIINTIPTIVWSNDPDGHVDFLNQRARHFWPNSVAVDGGFRWSLLCGAPANADASAFGTQYWTANVDPSDQCGR